MAEIKGMSIFRKTGLLAFALFGVISLLTSALAAYTMYDRLTQEYVSKGDAIAHSIASASQEILLNRDAATVQAMIDQYLNIEGVAYVFVKDSEGTVISHTFVPQIPPKLMTLLESGKGRKVYELEVLPYGRIIDISEPILAGVAGFVHVGMAKELIMEYFWAAVVKMQLLMFAILLACVGILYVVTMRISRPLTELTSYAERLAAHDFDATIEITSTDEIGVLGRSMASMAEELSTLFAEMESEVNKATGDLKEHMAYLSSIIDNLADGLLVISPSGTVTVMNPVMREFFDLGDKSYVGFAVSDVFPAEISDMAGPLRECGSEVLSAEIPLAGSRTGKAVGSSICVQEPVKQCMGCVILIRDITREKELDMLKTDFISTVSHELRTPMTSVLGFAKIIRKKLDRAIFPQLHGDQALEKPVMQVRENMEIIVDEAERLTDLINDVLDIAKMESGEAMWREDIILMEDVLRQSVDSTRGMWKAKKLQVDVEVEDGLMPVRGDRGRLVQVLVNLISNAVKFTDRGPVTCRAHMDGGYVLVSVQDLGVGIPENALDTIFDKFKQVGDTLTEKPTGTGLGLPICKQIVEHHGGSIWAESQQGEGSIFYFNIPATAVRKDDPAEVDPICSRVMPKPDTTMLVSVCDGPQEPLILVVDDDPSLGRFLKELYEGEGFRVAIAPNGEEAVEMARDLMPNLITMDIMMPQMDGRRAIKCLRSNPFTRNIPILVLSALADAFSMGGDIALTKPVDDDHLVEVTRALLLEKDMSRSCLFIGEEGSIAQERFPVMCPENMKYCDPDAVEESVEKGFKGTIFIPIELEELVDIEKISKAQGITIVVLPEIAK